MAERARPAVWAAVVVNYESGPLLERCVASLLGDGDSAPAVVVVSNGSTDGSAEAVERTFPAVPVIRPGANLGYGRAANLGIAATTAPIVAVVNPDVVVTKGAGAAAQARFAAEPDLAALGPRIRNPDGTTYPSARREPGPLVAAGHALLGRLWAGNPFSRRYRRLDADPSEARDVDWVSGAAIWLRREALDGAGGWDERFFMFLEDVDLCRTLRTQGWRVAYDPGLEVTHVVGASRAGRPYRSIVAHHRAALAYVRKWWRGPRRALVPLAAVLLGLRAAVALLLAAVARPRPAVRAD